MRQTKRFQINQRIFKTSDLKRIISVFDEQASLARKSDHHYSAEYTIHFSDNTSIESGSSDILEDASIDIKRPVKIELGFTNYKLERRMSLELTHGNSRYDNKFFVRASEASWLNNVFSTVEGLIKGAESRSFWFSRHPAILTSLFAVSLGSLATLLIQIIVRSLFPKELNLTPVAIDRIRALGSFIDSFKFWFYLFGWVWKWMWGFTLGAFPLAEWVLGAWPSIDLDFGADHLKIEKMRREKIGVIITLVVIPILISIILDVIRAI